MIPPFNDGVICDARRAAKIGRALFVYPAGGAGRTGPSVAGDLVLVNEVLATLSDRFEELYSHTGRPSIPPEYLLRATLLQAFFTVRSERQLMEQINYNLCFAGLSACRSTMPSGTQRSLRRTATGCWRPMWRTSSCPVCCRCRR